MKQDSVIVTYCGEKFCALGDDGSEISKLVSTSKGNKLAEALKLKKTFMKMKDGESLRTTCENDYKCGECEKFADYGKRTLMVEMTKKKIGEKEVYVVA